MRRIERWVTLKGKHIPIFVGKDAKVSIRKAKSVKGMKKLKVKKQYGEWYYKKEKPDNYNDLDAPVYILQKSDEKDGGEFGSYNDMKYYIETGKRID